MSWGKVDDKLWGSPKWLATPPKARAVWVTALSYCMDQLTDGHVPAHVLTILGGAKRDAADLVRVGLWETTDDGWVFHDWADYQPSREQILAERRAAADRQKRARERAKEKRRAEREDRDALRDDTPPSPHDSRESHAVTTPVTHGEVTPVVTVPPTRPDPTPVLPTEVLPPVGTPDAPPTVDAPPAAASADASAQHLLGEWLNHCNTRPPGRVIGHVARELKTLLDEGQPYDDVRNGLAAWAAKGLHPSSLASVVHETRTRKTTPRIATGTARAMTAIELGAQMQAAADAGTPLEITR